MQPEYTFGDGDRANERLHLLADVFGPSSRALLHEVRAHLASPPDRALDLGCGPGHTTALLAEALGAASTEGLDASERFIAAARAAHPDLIFAVHDVTRGALPGEPAGAVYARFLLTHLGDPTAALTPWRAALAPGGLLILEELHTMVGTAPSLQRYYELVESMQRAHGQDIRIGRQLPERARAAGLESVIDRVTRLILPGDRMARLHQLNLQTWKTSAWAQARCDPRELQQLEGALAELAGRPDPAVFVDYQMAQLVLRGRREPTIGVTP